MLSTEQKRKRMTAFAIDKKRKIAAGGFFIFTKARVYDKISNIDFIYKIKNLETEHFMFEIVTDNTADLYEGYYEQNPARRLPFSFTLEDRFYERDDEYPIELFYEKLKAGKLVRTSQINPHDAEVEFEKVLHEGKDVLYIGFSSGMSGSFDNISYIAKGLRIKYPERKIIVVDTLSGAGGEGLLFYYARKMQQEGKSMEEIAEWVENNKLNTHHCFIVSDLINLRNSGRISTLAALFGMIVHINPVLELTREGKIGIVTKSIGRKKSIAEMVKFFKQNYIPSDNDFILVGHTNCPEEAHAFGAQIEQISGGVPVKYGYINRLVSGCAGYNALSVFFMGQPRKDR